MRRICVVFLLCSLICITAYRFGDAKWENAKQSTIESFHVEVSKWMIPYLHTYEKGTAALAYEDMKRCLAPVIWEFRVKDFTAVKTEKDGQEAKENDKDKSDNSVGEDQTTQNGSDTKDSKNDSVETLNNAVSFEKKIQINHTKLQDFDYLRQNFYQVDNTTTIGKDQLDVNVLLEKDLTLQKNVDGPQILIYHTHSKEAYKDSVPGDASMTVVGLGDYLETLLEQKYGIEVLHHKGQYDVPSRDNAYSNALPNLEKILKENPTIEVVIDLHRDGVPEDRHLVTEINGKQTAKIMFFNGLSRTTAQGELSYLPNPYIADNLALSFQMQLAAAEYYPDFTRKIYLKGYRYNMHLCPKSMLIEVGAQTNTFQEAKNAMEPLANILAYVLKENSKE